MCARSQNEEDDVLELHSEDIVPGVDSSGSGLVWSWKIARLQTGAQLETSRVYILLESEAFFSEIVQQPSLAKVQKKRRFWSQDFTKSEHIYSRIRMRLRVDMLHLAFSCSTKRMLKTNLTRTGKRISTAIKTCGSDYCWLCSVVCFNIIQISKSIYPADLDIQFWSTTSKQLLHSIIMNILNS